MSAMPRRAFKTSDEAFAELFRAAREHKNLTQEEIAREMSRRGFDFHQQTIYKIESSRRKVTVGEAVALAELVSMKVEDLTDIYPDSSESLANNVRRSARDFAEGLFDLYDQVNSVRILRLEYVATVEEYARAPTAFFEHDDGTKIAMTEVFEELAQFPGLADYATAWRELLANPAAVATFNAVGWDTDDYDPDLF